MHMSCMHTYTCEIPRYRAPHCSWRTQPTSVTGSPGHLSRKMFFYSIVKKGNWWIKDETYRYENNYLNKCREYVYCLSHWSLFKSLSSSLSSPARGKTLVARGPLFWVEWQPVSPLKIGDKFNHQSWYLTQTSLLAASWWQSHFISQGQSLDPPNGNQPMEITHPKKGMFHHAENCHIWFPEGIYFIWWNVLWYDYLNSGTNFSFIAE